MKICDFFKLITQIKCVYFSLCCGKGTFFMSCRVSRKLVVFLSLRGDLRWKLICCPFPETTFFSSSLTSADPTTRNTQPQSPPQHTHTRMHFRHTCSHNVLTIQYYDMLNKNCINTLVDLVFGSMLSGSKQTVKLRTKWHLWLDDAANAEWN